jgi:ADP-ribose pyrophosphatase YjhB (NUDIX family)
MQEQFYDQPKHFLAVDCVIFGYRESELHLLLYNRNFEPLKGQWSLMGGFVQEDETVEEAAGRILFQITGLKDIYLDQVQVFSKKYRDPGARVVSVASYALIRMDYNDADLWKDHGAVWWPIQQLPELIFDHSEMVAAALEKLQLKANYSLIGQELLPEQFTIIQLRNLYEAIFQCSLDSGNFRKRIFSLKVLERLDSKDTAGSKKGAFYYKYKTSDATAKVDRIVRLIL